MAAMCEASVALLKGPTLDATVCALRARLCCHRAASAQLLSVLAREMVQRDPFSPALVPEDRARSVVASAPSSSFAPLASSSHSRSSRRSNRRLNRGCASVSRWERWVEFSASSPSLGGIVVLWGIFFSPSPALSWGRTLRLWGRWSFFPYRCRDFLQ